VKPVDQFDFQRREEGLGHGVVQARAGPPARLGRRTVSRLRCRPARRSAPRIWARLSRAPCSGVAGDAAASAGRGSPRQARSMRVSRSGSRCRRRSLPSGCAVAAGVSTNAGWAVRGSTLRCAPVPLCPRRTVGQGSQTAPIAPGVAIRGATARDTRAQSLSNGEEYRNAAAGAMHNGRRSLLDRSGIEGDRSISPVGLGRWMHARGPGSDD
jgi:hypothetical protein